MSAPQLILALHVQYNIKMQTSPGAPQLTLFDCTGLLSLCNLSTSSCLLLLLSLFIELCGWEVSILVDILSSSSIVWMELGCFSIFIRKCISQGCHNKEPQTRWLKRTKRIALQFWRLKVQNQSVSRSVLLLKLQGRLFPCLFSASLSSAFLGLHLQALQLLNSIAHGFSFCVPGYLLGILFLTHPSYWARAHPTPVRLHLN